jgi:hypothetical protein
VSRPATASEIPIGSARVLIMVVVLSVDSAAGFRSPGAIAG